MAKKSVVERDKKRRKMVARFSSKREELKRRAKDQSLSPQARSEARLALTCLPRNSSPSRVKNRCAITGRSRSYYRDFGISRIALRDLGSNGLIPGLTKSSW